MYSSVNVVFAVVLSIELVSASEYYVVLSSDSPVVRGGTVHFVAKLYDEDGYTPSGSFKYDWVDNSIRAHAASHESKSVTDTWNVTYPANDYFPPGPYEVQVSVSELVLLFYVRITSQRIQFKLTENLNGHLEMSQKGKAVDGTFVSNADPVVHKVVLNASDAEYLNTTATSVLTYWFVDCVYYGMSNDFTFTTNYNDVNKRHKVEALVVAGYEPITTPAPPTTTTTPITTTSTTTKKPSPITTKPPTTSTTSKSTTSLTTASPSKKDAHLLNNSVDTIEKRIKRGTNIGNATSTVTKAMVNGNIVPHNVSYPFVCPSNNNSNAPDANKTYGYFTTRFVVKAPVSNISVSGNYWLQQGDVLNLMVKCRGTPQFYYCKHVFEGIYNVTGNETCDVPTPDSSDKCEFPIRRFLRKPQKYTIAIVIYNDVGKIVSPVTVTVYEVKQQAQLSVIVVPVAFSLVAVVLIVFGVAYYVQNRSRFTVEVADFNFGQQGSDLEYKTFGERLRDSISNAFMRAPTPSSSEPTVWPPGRKYGSLT